MMHPSFATIGLASLCGSLVAAVPAAAATAKVDIDVRGDLLAPRADQTAPWVSVDDNAQPATTYTPSLTTENGVVTAVDGAPHDLTASLFTMTHYGYVSTRTGDSPNPTATGKGKQGAFTRCYNKDGENAPICAPKVGSTLETGNTYYVTWDPDYFNTTESRKSNTTYEITLRLDYLNRTSDEWKKLKDFDHVPAKWGFATLPMSSKFLKERDYTNVTITLLSSAKGSAEKNETAKVQVVMSDPPGAPDRPTPVPQGRTLYIAIPTVFGLFLILLVGGCVWNARTRRIKLGNVMSRSRHGYTGRSTRRMRRGNKDGGMRLDVAPAAGEMPLEEYHDMPDRPRRDSDALGSLAGSPVDPSFQQQGTQGGGSNAFRDEMMRQDRERRLD